MIFRRFARITNILCILLYLPVLLGSGECVALCFEPNGSLILDYTHRCGMEDNSSKAESMTEIKGVFSTVSFYKPVQAETCRDIPLAIGNHTHFVPEINHSLYPGRICGEYPVLMHNHIQFSAANFQKITFLYPLQYLSPNVARDYSVLII